MKNMRKKFICLMLALLLILTGASGCGNSPKNAQKETEPAATVAVRRLNEKTQTFLIVVTDAYDVSDAAGSYRNGSRADFLLLLVVDEAAGTVRTLQLNPDLMVPFSVPGKSGTVEIPLGQVYSYGSGGSDSYLNLCKAVSDVLQRVPVQHYLSFTMDAIGTVSEVLEGVTLEGSAEAATLSGEEAVAYFRSRDEEDIANEIHMEHQRQFMLGMYQPFMTSAQNDDFLTRLTMQLGDRMATDLTISQLLPMFETLAAYEMEKTVLTVSGKAESVQGEYRFYGDAASINQVLDQLIPQ